VGIEFFFGFFCVAFGEVAVCRAQRMLPDALYIIECREVGGYFLVSALKDVAVH
jgi:hypothetical protein